MKEELQKLFDSISAEKLPSEFDAAFGEIFDAESSEFRLQENVVLDYKEAVPDRGDTDYKSGLLKLIASFHNAFGGLIVFGVRNSDFKPVGVDKVLDIEEYNSLFSEVFHTTLELVRRIYTLEIDGVNVRLCAVMVPRRKSKQPVTAKRDYGQIKSGATFIRERHEALTASNRHFPILYSERSNLPQNQPEDIVGIQYFAPPSSSTVPTFIGRESLERALWEWLIVDRKPRLYLSGPGGSGKSTLAYEFMEQVARSWQMLRLRNNERLDFVAFFSGKETELNIRTAEEKPTVLKQFSNSREQFEIILSNVGAEDPAEISELSSEGIIENLEGLFNAYNGLIVIDDIDALSRAGLDTGEEDLFLLASQSSKVVKVLYTLRNDATYAKNAALPVPGLERKREAPAFLDACCRLFGAEIPQGGQVNRLLEESSYLPLLIETIVGLRASSSSYDQAIRDFKERGGDAARSYLYRREYEKLARNGKGRQVLAALMEYGRPIGFDAICTITSVGDVDSVRMAINETNNIFLKVSSSEDGTTVYSLTPSAAGFVRSVSKELPYFPAVKRAVEHYRNQTAKSTPREASIISTANRHLRQKEYKEIINLDRALENDDAVRVNPAFMSILGRALVQSSPPDLVRARELFRSSLNFGFDDVFMLRAWYHAEKQAGYRFSQAIDVCKLVVENAKYSDRHRSEFSSKIGEAFSVQARQISGIENPDKAKLYANAVANYLWGLHFARDSNNIDRSKTMDWLTRSMQGYISTCAGDFLILFQALEEHVKRGLSVDAETAAALEVIVSGSARSRNVHRLRKAQGTLRGGLNVISKAGGKGSNSAVRPLIESVDNAKKQFELRIMQVSSR